MKRIFTLLASIVFIAQLAIAQTSPQYNSAEILHKLQKLNTVGSVLYIAAHPDDENTRLLAYLANHRKYRTGYLALTRGDGGQNLIGTERGELLGLVRTQELLAARRTDGAEQFFTRANDFGYSKNPEETFKIWNKDSILADAVWVIRNFKPDVIICRFPPDERAGHGHHSASAIIAHEAFEAAADPNRFPEQLKHAQVWQAKRIFWNTYRFSRANTTSEDQIKINVGEYNPLLGKSYGEIASESRSMHKSQGFGSIKRRGEIIEYFKLIKGDKVTNKDDILKDINTNWSRISGTKKIQKLLDKIIASYSALTPEKSVNDLVELYKEIKSLSDKDDYAKYWKEQKLKECQELIVACAGIWAEAYADNSIAVVGDSISTESQILCNTNTNVKLLGIHFLEAPFDKVENIEIGNKSASKGKIQSFEQKFLLPNWFKNSSPYWLDEPHELGLYTVREQLKRGKPENDPQAKVVFHIEIEGQHFAVRRPIVYKYRDPVKGEVYRPLEILPSATVNIAEQVYIFNDEKPQTIKFVVKANQDNVKGSLKITIPQGWSITIKNPSVDLKTKGEEQIIEATLKATPNSKDGVISATLLLGTESINKSIYRVEYDHFPYQFWLKDTEAKLVNIPLNKTEITVGYINGAGDEVANSLRLIGYNVVELTDDMLMNDDLSQYGAIVAGIRAYNVNKRMPAYYNRLMEYVKQGGNYIVQYNTNSFFGPLNAKMGPFDFKITRNRVTDEFAKVNFVNAEHPVLNQPNKITDKDFENWVQERGIYFAEEYGDNFTLIFSIADPNEEPHQGSLIIAEYGKGNFAYTGLSFFRELPAGVPGAYRLFVNLISLPKNE
jgi:LmbE family N-acetylglucosaminyl deacetylase